MFNDGQVKESPVRALRNLIEANPDYKAIETEYGVTILRRVTCYERPWSRLFRLTPIERGKPVCSIDYWPLNEYPRVTMRTADDTFAKYAASLGFKVELI